MPSNASPSQSEHLEHELICQIVEEGSKVLDLGCGEGDLLKKLQERKKAQCTGVEVSDDKVYECISKGLTAYHGDIDEGLEDFPDKTFDYVILSETLQEVRKPKLVIAEMLRVGRRGIVSFPNFGYWKSRCQLFFFGRAPITEALPFDWYDGPNIQFLSIKDFYRFCDKENHQIVQKIFMTKGRIVKIMPNLLAESALCVLA